MSYLNKKQSYFLILLCFLVYVTGYIGRLNYNAALVEIKDAFKAENAEMGLVSSFFFFAYGSGQLINGLLSKRYNTRIMIFISLILTCAINFAMPFSGGVSIMKWLWLLNGFAQSILWSSIIQTLSVYVPDNILPKAILIISATVATGTFFAYGFAALGSAIGSWQLVFYIAAAVSFAIAILWFTWFGYIQKTAAFNGKTNSENKGQPKDGDISKAECNRPLVSNLLRYLTPAVLVTAVAAVSNGFVKDGAITWTPSVLHEMFNLEKSYSVALTFILPLISLFGAFTASLLRKKIANLRLLIGFFFIIALSGLLLLIFVFLPVKSLILTLSVLALVSLCMSAVNNILTSVIPLNYRNKVSSGMLAGVINTFCYVGSTLSAVLLGLTADTKGWTATFAVMAFAAALAVLTVSLSFINKLKKPSA